mmetsp:Transcript_71290/g.143519  ORF Transcript_71290/g.143519 Transcript_71290/m.143519 type:complete len:93 (-) Transcript_71290:68-346(-)
MEQLEFLLVGARDLRVLATAKALVAVGEPKIAISDFSFFNQSSQITADLVGSRFLPPSALSESLKRQEFPQSTSFLLLAWALLRLLERIEHP